MAFPLSPTNLQQTTVDGINFIYWSNANAWFRQTINTNTFNVGNLIVGGNGTIIANNIVTTSGSNANLFIDPDGTADVVLSPATTLWILENAASTSTSTGALVVAGGAGIAGNIYAGANISVTGNINATGNLTIGNVNTTGTETVGNLITTGGAYYPNGASVFNVAASGFATTGKSIAMAMVFGG